MSEGKQNISISLTDGRELDFYDIYEFRLKWNENNELDYLYFKHKGAIGRTINTTSNATIIVTVPMRNVLYYERTIEDEEK